MAGSRSVTPAARRARYGVARMGPSALLLSLVVVMSAAVPTTALSRAGGATRHTVRDSRVAVLTGTQRRQRGTGGQFDLAVHCVGGGRGNRHHHRQWILGGHRGVLRDEHIVELLGRLTQLHQCRGADQRRNGERHRDRPHRNIGQYRGKSAHLRSHRSAADNRVAPGPGRGRPPDQIHRRERLRACYGMGHQQRLRWHGIPGSDRRAVRLLGSRLFGSLLGLPGGLRHGRAHRRDRLGPPRPSLHSGRGLPRLPHTDHYRPERDLRRGALAGSFLVRRRLPGCL